MEKFLDTIARDIQARNHLSTDTCIVLPNKRSGVFLKNAFAAIIDKPVLLPSIVSMEEFVSQMTGIKVPDALRLYFELYEAHKKIESKPDDFETFLGYAPTLIHDFNEFDLYLVEHHQAFSYMSDASRLNTWKPMGGELTGHQKKYIQFFEKMESYYTTYKKKLLTNKIAYQGLLFRTLAENPEMTDKSSFSRFWFVGFNALSRSEREIISQCRKRNETYLRFDADQYYIENEYHEAGLQLRRLFRLWPDAKKLSSDWATKKKNITVYDTPGQVAEVKTLAGLLEHADETSEVAVILADEQLLEPLLNSIPKQIGRFNVTMGLPLRRTPVFSLLEKLFRLHTQKEQNNVARHRKEFYHKDILSVLSHPLLRQALHFRNQSKSISYSTIHEEATKTGKAFYDSEDIEALLKAAGLPQTDTIAFLWQTSIDSPQKLLDLFAETLNFIQLAVNAEKQITNPVQNEYVRRFIQVVSEMKLLDQHYQTLETPQSVWQVFQRLTASETVNFRGEPLEGIQIMGMLETRLLDFKHVIICSANEHFIPGHVSEQTFIPFDLKQMLQLPTQKEKSAVYAYHFYRLLQRAEKVDILYNSLIEGFRGSEMSRFVKQLEMELPDTNPNILIQRQTITFPSSGKQPKKKLKVEKTSSVLEAVYKKFQSGLSASSLNMYRACPLKFYFQEIAGIPQREEVEETIEARTLGNIIHKTLENLYNSFAKGRPVDKTVLDKISEYAGEESDRQFTHYFKASHFKSGRNMLVYHVAKSWLQGLINLEDQLNENNTQRIYLESEKNISILKHPVINGQIVEVKFKGLIDRVEEIDGSPRIIDYKTGKVTPSQLRIKDLQELKEKPDQKEVFQLLFYAWLMQEAENKFIKTPYILSFPSLSEGLMPLQIGKENILNTEILQHFETYIIELTQQIGNPQVAFYQTDDLEICKYCEFKRVCNRDLGD
jgi:CRISPR/Cas system-associated exonuclease Cas4 (RecB family)